MLLHFDYDGVIANSMAELAAITLETQQAFGCGRPPSMQDYAAIENLTFENHARHLGIPETQVAEFVTALFERQNRDSRIASLYPGIQVVLTSLSTQDQIVIVTSSYSPVIERSLRYHGLEGAVSSVLGGELGLTKAGRIRQSCAAAGVNPASSFMVGDTVGDILQGKQAGALTIAVSWGFHPRSMLLAASPDFIADRPEHLLSILRPAHTGP